jgi:hypothetical protein
MKTRKLVESMLSFIEHNRQVGNTPLLLEGARNYDRPFYILGWNQDHATEKCEGIPNAKPMSIQQIESFMGTNEPIAIDPDVMGWLIGKVAYEFDQLELQLERERLETKQDVSKYSTIANELMTKVEDQQKVLINRGELLMKIGQMTWWERIFSAPRLIHQLFQLELKNNQI